MLPPTSWARPCCKEKTSLSHPASPEGSVLGRAKKGSVFAGVQGSARFRPDRPVEQDAHAGALHVAMAGREISRAAADDVGTGGASLGNPPRQQRRMQAAAAKRRVA